MGDTVTSCWFFSSHGESWMSCEGSKSVRHGWTFSMLWPPFWIFLCRLALIPFQRLFSTSSYFLFPRVSFLFPKNLCKWRLMFVIYLWLLIVLPINIIHVLLGFIHQRGIFVQHVSSFCYLIDFLFSFTLPPILFFVYLPIFIWLYLTASLFPHFPRPSNIFFSS